MAGVPRPFKVWSADRSIKKSLTAASLADLITDGCGKLGLSGSGVRAVLECDGTEVDEENYFSFLNNDTTLMLLTPSDTWRPAGQEEVGRGDEPDTAHGMGPSPHATHLLTSLKKDVTRIITFSDDDLQSLIDLHTADLARELGESERYAQSVKDACQRHMDERQSAKDAIDLLRLYDKARSVSPYVDADHKKRRHSPDPGQS